MKARQLIQLGIPNGPAIQIARKALRHAATTGLGKADRRRRLIEVIEDPAASIEFISGRLDLIRTQLPPKE